MTGEYGHSRILARMLVCLGLCLLTRVPSAEGFAIYSTISPQIIANPIEVVIWIKNGVTPENEARVIDQIRQGLQMWEDVPTSRIRFDIVSIIRSAVDPGKQPHQLQIIVGNSADLTSGGASLPYDGNPGTWYGAVADNPDVQLVTVTAHEVGHAVGLLHTTISIAYPILQQPIMHFAIGSPVALQDDVAAISSAYPQPGLRLLDVGGAIRGRLITVDTTTPIRGVNVVAVNMTTSVPMVAQISKTSGKFNLVGLPPATYRIYFKGGHSYAGSSLGFWNGAQADNFKNFSIGPITIIAGQVVKLNKIPVKLFPMSINGVHVGEIDRYADSISLEPVGSTLPMAQLGSPYEIWLHVRGGLRDLYAQVSGSPAGLIGFMAADPRVPNVRTYGSWFVRVQGTPSQRGSFILTIRITDAQGAFQDFRYGLTVI